MIHIFALREDGVRILNDHLAWSHKIRISVDSGESTIVITPVITRGFIHSERNQFNFCRRSGDAITCQSMSNTLCLVQDLRNSLPIIIALDRTLQARFSCSWNFNRHLGCKIHSHLGAMTQVHVSGYIPNKIDRQENKKEKNRKN
jgi:hypothetical protein